MILSKSQLVSNINNEISDQSYGQISPYDIRHNLLDIIDSISNLTFDKNLESLNFSTFPSGNTKIGIGALTNYLEINHSISHDNTAIGYNALRSNYQSVKNTAVGSSSLSCNVYGEGNIALGYNALAGNTVGHLNIGIGNYTLHNNKSGNGNIAIGHGAGYYVNKNTNFKLFIGYHPVDEQHICDNPDGNNWIPLMYGDLSGIRLGIGTRSLNEYGTLHVSGNILPSNSDTHTLGHNLYHWSKLYLSKSIEFTNNSSIFASGSKLLCVENSLYPSQDNQYSLGSPSYAWNSGHFYDIVVTGTAVINQLNYSNIAIYSNKTFYLGVDSNNIPLYADNQLDGGGLVLKSSTNNKEYKISFVQPIAGMPGFSAEYNGTWNSNINIQVPTDRYVRTNNLISYDTAAFNSNDSFGLFFNSGITYISRKNVLGNNLGLSNGHVAGISNINFISNSGSLQDYSFSLMSLESGVSISQKFLTGTKRRVKDVNNLNKDKLQGFELKYIDESSSNVVGHLLDRFVVNSYNDSSQPINSFSMMKESVDGGVFCITNMPSISENILPKTIFNVRSINDCIARLTAESNGYYKSSLQLLGSSNCESSGVEIAYLNNSGIADIIIYKNSNATNFIRMKDTNEIGILSSGITNSAITIGHSGMNQLPVISIKDNTFVTNSGVVASSGYGKIYNLRDARSYANQFNSLFYSDSSGNQFNLVVNKLDNVDGRAVYVDGSGNTFAGYLSPSGRSNINESIKNNTSYGQHALYSIKSGSGNIGIGCGAMYTLSSGNNNIVIGESLSGISNTSNNIVIGNKSYYQNTNHSTSGNIIIGHNLIPYYSGSYNFILGNLNRVLLQGTLGPNNADKKLVMPSGGKLYIHNDNNTESLSIKANVIEIIDSGGVDYPENDLTFKFSANNSADLLVLNHYGPPLTNTANYAQHKLANDLFIVAPYAQLNGDFRLKGFLCFSDGTTLNTSSGIAIATNLANSGISLGNSGIALANSGIQRINSTLIEGFMPNGLQAPVVGQKTSGIMVLKDSLWADSGSIFIINRDATSVIHSGAYVIASIVNNEYKPIWISANDTTCACCNH